MQLRRLTSGPGGGRKEGPQGPKGSVRPWRCVKAGPEPALTPCFPPQDKKYATDKYKDIYTELSIVKAKAERDLGRLRDQLQLAHDALGEPSLDPVERGGYGKPPVATRAAP